jgi:hypothetical protein
MKISDIILEAVDQKEADEVLKSLVASGDPSAKFFQQTRYNPVHSSIDSAQRAAERMAQAEQKRKASPQATAATKPQASAVRQQSKQKPEKQDRDPEDYSDRFYGNRYTGSLGRGARLGDVDLDIDFDQSGLQTIGKTIGAVKAAAKPFSNLATAFKAGMSKAPSKR